MDSDESSFTGSNWKSKLPYLIPTVLLAAGAYKTMMAKNLDMNVGIQAGLLFTSSLLGGLFVQEVTTSDNNASKKKHCECIDQQIDNLKQNKARLNLEILRFEEYLRQDEANSKKLVNQKQYNNLLQTALHNDTTSSKMPSKIVMAIFGISTTAFGIASYYNSFNGRSVLGLLGSTAGLVGGCAWFSRQSSYHTRTFYKTYTTSDNVNYSSNEKNEDD